MKNLLYILASLCLPFFLQAQTKLSGKILDEQNKAIEAASVILKDSVNQSIPSLNIQQQHHQVSSKLNFRKESRII